MAYKIFIVLTITLVCFTLTSGYEDEYDDRHVPEIGNYLIDLLSNNNRRAGRTQREEEDELENWTGRWMPEGDNDPTPPPKILPHHESDHTEYSTEVPHRIEMGRINSKCDDAKTNLTIDWDNSPVNHTCYDKSIYPDKNLQPEIYCEHIPENYVAAHKCMYEKIEYDTDIPIYGTHRPLWPVYGEYKFVPRQRWLHNLEHGAVVMLYHPCAYPGEIKKLKALVKGCLYRHIITPYTLLDEERPLALVTWGCRLTMSHVNPNIVKNFIRESALRGPEQTWKNGNFNFGLLEEASDILGKRDDSNLCPNMN